MKNLYENYSNFINNNKLNEEEAGEAVKSPVNTTSDMVVHKGKIGKIIRRRMPKMSKKIFSTMDIKENKLTKNEYESLLNRNTTVIVPIDDENIEFKLLNFDDYGRVYENTIMINDSEKKIYIESNSKETLNYLLMENDRSRFNTMRLPEMKHIYSFVKSLIEGFKPIIIHDDKEYNIKF